MVNNTPTPVYDNKKDGGFVFGDQSANSPNKILDLAEVKAYLVSYTDGASQKQTRLAFRVPGSVSTFVFNERIQGQFVATIGADWFQKEFRNKVRDLGLEATEDDGTEGVGQV